MIETNVELSGKHIYLDYQATTPVDSIALGKMLPFFRTSFGNYSSPHYPGLLVNQAVEEARDIIAKNCGALSSEIFFTSGATEANNLAIKGIAEQRGFKGHIITTAIEHKSVLSCVDYLEQQGVLVTRLRVNSFGHIDIDELKQSIRPDTFLISLMYVNNEIGAINPIAQIAKISKAQNIYFHCDASQAFTSLNVDVKMLGVDLLTASAHKFYGPKGVGFLWVKRTLQRSKALCTQIHGGGQEAGLRSGTINSALIIGMAEALNQIVRNRSADRQHYLELRKSFLQRLINKKISFQLNAPYEVDAQVFCEESAQYVPSCLNLAFEASKSQSQRLFSEILSKASISTSSACNQEDQLGSYVLSAMGLATERIANSYRVSFGRETSVDDVSSAVEHICKSIQGLNSFNETSIAGL